MGSDNSIICKLEEQEKKEGTLPPLLEFYLKVLRVQSEAEQRIGVSKVGLTGEAINERIEQGQPLITFDELDIKWPLLLDISEKVTGVFTENRGSVPLPVVASLTLIMSALNSSLMVGLSRSS